MHVYTPFCKDAFCAILQEDTHKEFIYKNIVIYSCTYTYIYMHIHMYAYTYIYVYIYMHVYTPFCKVAFCAILQEATHKEFIYKHIHIYIYIYTYIYAYTYICIYIYIYVYIYIYAYIHTVLQGHLLCNTP